jgi:hypothetical protein
MSKGINCIKVLISCNPPPHASYGLQEEEELVHKIGLAFTVSTLYLLVQPRPEDEEEFMTQVG